MVEIEGFFAVSPKIDCPHCIPENIWSLENFKNRKVTDPCYECSYVGENWICLKPDCATVACSRYVQSHMKESHHM